MATGYIATMMALGRFGNSRFEEEKSISIHHIHNGETVVIDGIHVPASMPVDEVEAFLKKYKEKTNEKSIS